MTPTKVISFLLGLLGLAGLLCSVLLSFGPFLVPLPPPGPLSQLSPGCLTLLLFVAAAPFASLPGLLGLGLWLFVVRKQEAATVREAMALPNQEEAFQAHVDGMVRYLLDHRGVDSTVAAQLQAWIERFPQPQQQRMRLFLVRYGILKDVKGFPPDAAKRRDTAPAWNVRTFAQLLLALGVFFFLWGVLVAFTHLETDVLRRFGFETGLGPAILGSSGCFILGLAAVSGWWGLRWLMNREARNEQYLQGFRERARQLALDGCHHRIEQLLRLPEDRQVAESIAQAMLFSTLPELDGIAKGHLISRLHAKGFLPRADLSGADLRGAILANTDLSGAFLAGADLSGARLTGARLFLADLHQSCLRGADLRDVAAESINLRQADLRDADLLRSNLRSADLGEASFAGANLWKVDLTGADLTGTLISAEQLAATVSHRPGDQGTDREGS